MRTPSKHTLRPRRGEAHLSNGSARRLRPQLIADAVIANYIHDISVRHRRRGTGTEPPRRQPLTALS